MVRSVSVLAVAAAALAWGIAQAWAENEHVYGRMCVFAPVASEDGSLAMGGQIYREFGSIMMATRHVNSRNCSIIGPGCEKFLRGANGVEVFLNASLWDVHSFNPTTVPVMSTRCFEGGADFLVGPLSSGQASLASLLASSYGGMVMSSVATSASLSNKALYAAFARSCPSDYIFVEGVHGLLRKMGWTQVTVVHNDDLFGNGFADAFYALGLRREVRSERVSLGATQTGSDVANAALQLGKTGNKVVVLATFKDPLLAFLKECVRQYTPDELDGFTFIYGTNSPEELVSMHYDELLADPTLFSLVRGMVGLDHFIESELEQKLVRGLQEYNSRFFEGDVRAAMAGSTWGGSLPAQFAEPLASSLQPKPFSFMSYDLVWALAHAIAVAEGSEDNDESMNPAQRILSLIREKRIPAIPGTTFASWDEKGDPELVTRLSIVQYQGRDPEGAAVRGRFTSDVGLWGLEGGVTLFEGVPLRWRDGSEWPSVPHDGSSGSEDSQLQFVAILVVIASLALLLALLGACLGRKNMRLRRKNKGLSEELQSIHSFQSFDIDSPVDKAIKLMKDIQMGVFKSGKGGMQLLEERAGLVRLALVTSTNVNTPNLQDAGISPELAKFLAFATGPDVDYRMRRSSFGSTAASEYSFSSHMSQKTPSSSTPHDSAYAFGDFVDAVDLVAADDVAKEAEVGHSFAVDVLDMERSCTLGGVLVSVAMGILDEWGVFDVLGLSSSKVRTFLAKIEDGYGDVPYHCAAHAADVTARLGAMLAMSGIAREMIGTKENALVLFAVVVAAAVHDYLHPGLSNDFLVKTEGDVAVRFNDQAVIENESIFKALGLPEYASAVRDLPRPERRRCRTLIIHSVLGTDMSRHFDIMAQVNSKVVNDVPPGRLAFSSLQPDQQHLVLMLALKAADVGHCAMPLELHLVWLARLEDELFAVGDLERKLNLPISPMMDRSKPGVYIGQNQLGFFGLFVLPMLRTWSHFFPQCRALEEQADANFEFWKAHPGPPPTVPLPPPRPDDPPSPPTPLSSSPPTASHMHAVHLSRLQSASGLSPSSSTTSLPALGGTGVSNQGVKPGGLSRDASGMLNPGGGGRATGAAMSPVRDPDMVVPVVLRAPPDLDAIADWCREHPQPLPMPAPLDIPDIARKSIRAGASGSLESMAPPASSGTHAQGRSSLHLAVSTPASPVGTPATSPVPMRDVRLVSEGNVILVTAPESQSP